MFNKKIICSMLCGAIIFGAVSFMTVKTKASEKVKFQVQKLTDTVTKIESPSHEFMYLVEGKEKAALIDTGSGVGELKEVVDGLTDKPITVLLTHGHLDHAMGAADFEDVYMNKVDKDVYMEHSKMPVRIKNLAITTYPEIENSDIQAQMKIPKDINLIKPLKDGDSFSLGGITLEAISVPGHTKGSMVFLDKEDKILFLGDACNNLTFLYDDYSTTIETYKWSLEKLRDRTKGLYNRALICHGKADISIDVVDNVIEAASHAVGKSDYGYPVENFMLSGITVRISAEVFGPENMCRVDGKEGNIVYRKTDVRPTDPKSSDNE